MSAPKNNEFWKLRLKHGRDRIIESPESLWENACEYFKWCNDNPIYEISFMGKDVQQVEIPHPRVYQKPAFAVACGVSCWNVINSLKTVNEDFFKVITRIEEIIYTQKFEHAAVGMFNASIIARDLGLKENIDATTNGKDITHDVTLSDEQLATVLNAIKPTD